MPFPKMDLRPLCQLYGINIAGLPVEIQNKLRNVKFDHLEAVLLDVIGIEELSGEDFKVCETLLNDIRLFKHKPMMKFFERSCKQNIALISRLQELQDIIEKLETMPTRPNSPKDRNSFAKGSKTIDVQINPYCVALSCQHFEN